jgi:hypothetical protein
VISLRLIVRLGFPIGFYEGMLYGDSCVTELDTYLHAIRSTSRCSRERLLCIHRFCYVAPKFRFAVSGLPQQCRVEGGMIAVWSGLTVQVSSPMRVQIVPAKAQSSSTPTLFSMSVDPRCWLNQPRLG